MSELTYTFPGYRPYGILQDSFRQQNQPAAIRVGSYIYVGVLQGERDTPANDPVDLVVFRYDIDTGGVVGPAVVTQTEFDNHYKPSIVRDADGYLHVFYGNHNQPMKHAKSVNPDDFRTWQVKASIGDDLTYHVPMTIGSTLYVFTRFRIQSQRGIMRLWKSTDGGETWTSEDLVSSADEYAYQGSFRVVDGVIHYAFNLRHQMVDGRHVGYIKYDTSDGKLYGADGTELEKPADLADLIATDSIVSHNGDEEAWSDAFDFRDGNPCFAYVAENSGDARYEIWYAEWDGEEWNRTLVFHGSPLQDWRDGRFIRLVADGSDVAIYETLYSFHEGSRNFGRWVSSDGGATWAARTIAYTFSQFPYGLRNWSRVYTTEGQYDPEYGVGVECAAIGETYPDYVGGAKLIVFDLGSLATYKTVLSESYILA